MVADVNKKFFGSCLKVDGDITELLVYYLMPASENVDSVVVVKYVMSLECRHDPTL